jgi:hypothetical protein
MFIGDRVQYSCITAIEFRIQKYVNITFRPNLVKLTIDTRKGTTGGTCICENI